MTPANLRKLAADLVFIKDTLYADGLTASSLLIAKAREALYDYANLLDGQSGNNVVVAPIVSRLDGDPNWVIQQAASEPLSSVAIVGEDSQGTEYFFSNMAGGPEVLWMLERAKLKLLRVVDEER